jgi:ABC-2 type transport system permease protein
VSARSAAALTLTSLLVVGLGAVLRSAAGTITTAVAVLFAPPILGALVSNEIVAAVLDHLPAGLGGVVASGTGDRYSPEVAALLLAAWAVGALGAGVISLHRRNPDHERARRAAFDQEHNASNRPNPVRRTQ